ncbi:hypothetical protein OC846_005252 [Tilletia horrida]|uniref:FAD dependent oxidoreductase domain-containing protein n=1 Tax=Tilletia horrida TaxID=155126 RepID=A0AAN6JW57_9BASI|nr:hypothetical protein OC845_004926 [Tilletia horrida]KAK0546456.1 hypothetical protein OC846_005252 [Tilletia horrida]
MTPNSEHPVIIVGAGVIGLTAAVVLRERGYTVFLLGREIPTDLDSPNFASVWAGANWCSYAGPNDYREQKWETSSWHSFLKIKESRPDLVSMYPFLQYLPTEVEEKNLWYSKLTPDFRILGKVPDGMGQNTFCLSYKSITVHVPHYLQYLWDRATGPASGSRVGPPVEIHRIPNLPSLSSVLAFLPAAYERVGPGAIPILVNATGLGARDLSDVKDAAVHPARGQTVLVHAPAIKRSVVHAGKESHLSPGLPDDGAHKAALADKMAELDVRATHEGAQGAVTGSGSPAHEDGEEDIDGGPSYVIPRASSGDVILGGTYQENRWDYEPEEKTTLRILDHCHKICPEVAVPYGQHLYRLRCAEQNDPATPALLCPTTGLPSYVWTPRVPHRLFSAAEALEQLKDNEDAVEVLRANVGLRPARHGGVRLELSTLSIPEDVTSPYVKFASDAKRDVPLVHAYGLGPAGYQQSWGVANSVADLVGEAAL